MKHAAILARVLLGCLLGASVVVRVVSGDDKAHFDAQALAWLMAGVILVYLAW